MTHLTGITRHTATSLSLQRKTLVQLLVAALILLVLPAAQQAVAQSARVNVVHNSPYGAVATVDVYINDDLAIDDFDFREATGFIDLPAETELEIDLTAADAEDSSEPLFTKSFTLDADGAYLLVAAGNPSETSGDTAFDLFAAAGREAADTAGNVEFNVFHGAPDAPAVDVVARGAGTLVDDIAFGSFTSDYLSVGPAMYDLDVTTADGSTVVASYYADLSGAAGAALSVLASGFLNPDEGDPAFGLLAVFADGSTMLLPTNTASAQIIHNSPYAAAATVDVYVNGTLAVDDLDFRAATGFLDLPAGTSTETAPELEIDITAPDAEDNSSPVFTKMLQLISGQSYVVVAAGDPSETSGDTAFDLFAAAGQTEAESEGDVALQIFHGAPDAPAVDAVVPAEARLTLADDLAFGWFEPYQSVPEADYPLNIETADNAAVVAQFEAPLESLSLGGTAIVVLASGFLSPDEGRPGFALLVALPAGGELVALPVLSGVAVDDPTELPGSVALRGNYPNPFNPATTVSFDLPRDAQVSVEVFDATGRQVMALPVQSMQAGAARTLTIGADNLPSGVYLYRLTARMGDEVQVETAQMTLIK